MDIGNLVIFILGTAAIIGILFWVSQANRKDLAMMAAELGLTVEAKGPIETYDDPTRSLGYRWQQRILTGQMRGYQVGIWRRTWRLVKLTPNNNSSSFTVMSFDLPEPSATPLLIESQTLGGLHGALFGGWETAVTGDDSFDKTFRVSSSNPDRIRESITPVLREQLLAFHAAAGGPMPDNAAASLTRALLMGVFEVEPNRVSFVFMGTPRADATEAFKRATPVLELLAKRI